MEAIAEGTIHRDTCVEATMITNWLGLRGSMRKDREWYNERYN